MKPEGKRLKFEPSPSIRKAIREKYDKGVAEVIEAEISAATVSRKLKAGVLAVYVTGGNIASPLNNAKIVFTCQKVRVLPHFPILIW